MLDITDAQISAAFDEALREDGDQGETANAWGVAMRLSPDTDLEQRRYLSYRVGVLIYGWTWQDYEGHENDYARELEEL